MMSSIKAEMKKLGAWGTIKRVWTGYKAHKNYEILLKKRHPEYAKKRAKYLNGVATGAKKTKEPVAPKSFNHVEIYKDARAIATGKKTFSQVRELQAKKIAKRKAAKSKATSKKSAMVSYRIKTGNKKGQTVRISRKKAAQYRQRTKR